MYECFVTLVKIQIVEVVLSLAVLGWNHHIITILITQVGMGVSYSVELMALKFHQCRFTDDRL
jgi:hypothetical protein